MGWKMPLCKWHTFWMAPCLIFFFFCHIVLYWEKVTSYEKFSCSLPFKSKLSAKFQLFNAIDRSMEMLKNSWIFQKFQLKWKIVKHFVRPKQRATLRKSFSVLPSYTRPDKTLIRLWHKNVLEFFYIL